MTIANQIFFRFRCMIGQQGQSVLYYRKNNIGTQGEDLSTEKVL